jgi:hypothetical protein
MNDDVGCCNPQYMIISLKFRGKCFVFQNVSFLLEVKSKSGK